MQLPSITDIKGWSMEMMAQYIWIKLMSPDEMPLTEVSLEGVCHVDGLKKAIKRRCQMCLKIMTVASSFSRPRRALIMMTKQLSLETQEN